MWQAKFRAEEKVYLVLNKPVESLLALCASEPFAGLESLVCLGPLHFRKVTTYGGKKGCMNILWFAQCELDKG